MKCIERRQHIRMAGCSCLAIKSSKALVPARAWTTCEDITLNERNQDHISFESMYMKSSEKNNPETGSVSQAGQRDRLQEWDS